MAQGAGSPEAPAILSEGCAPKFDIARPKSARWLDQLPFDSLSVSSRTPGRIFCATSVVVSGFSRTFYAFANTGIDSTTALFDPNPAFSEGGDQSWPP